MLWKPSNVAELKQFFKEEGGKIPPQRCEWLIASCRKHLIAIVATKDGTTILFEWQYRVFLFAAK